MLRSEPGGEDGPDLRVLQLCAPAGVGGLEQVVQGLTRGLAGRGHQVRVVAVVDREAPDPEFLVPGPGERHELGVIRLSGRDYLGELRAVREEFRRWRPQILHTHGYRPDLLHGARARRVGIATVSTLHGSSRMGGASHLFESLQERVLRDFDGVIAVSPALAHHLADSGVPPARVHMIPNAWHPRFPFRSRAEARRLIGLGDRSLNLPVIGWIGRLIPIKGGDLFLRALSSLMHETSSIPLPIPEDWVAVIVGEGPERMGLVSLARELGLESRVIFTGALPEAARILPAFDALALTSRSEGTPMVLLEAMQAQVPIVATAVGGVPDMFPPSGGAVLVPPGDPGGIARALAFLLSDEEAADGRARDARAWMETRHSPERWLDAHEGVYRAALTRRDG